MMNGFKPEVWRVEPTHGTFPPRWEVDLVLDVYRLRWAGTAVDYKDAIRQAGTEWEHVYSCADDALVPLTDDAG